MARNARRPEGRERLPLCWLWAGSILLVWLLIAWLLGQPLWQTQHSRDLARFGAVRGADFAAEDWWRLIASQWLHVRPQHMLFNAAVIATVGAALERRLGRWLPLIAGVGGGALGQVATLAWAPQFYASGASQAYLVLCGAAALALPVRSIGWAAAMAAVAAAAGLDLFVSGHGAPKIGHIVGLGAGLMAGAWLRPRA